MKFVTTAPDEIVLKPDLVLLLQDAVTEENRLLGEVKVKIGGRDPQVRKDPEGVFGFLGLADGDYTVNVESDEETPYYVTVDIPVTLPFLTKTWPAYPDRGLADPELKLDDENQPPAYKAQRALAALAPTTSYPFSAGATLVRGRVLDGDTPIESAMVKVSGNGEAYTTAKSGEYVLFFARLSGSSVTATLVATHPGYSDATVAVNVLRGTTVLADIAMTA